MYPTSRPPWEPDSCPRQTALPPPLRGRAGERGSPERDAFEGLTASDRALASPALEPNRPTVPHPSPRPSPVRGEGTERAGPGRLEN
ncbi:hypothetical protein CDS [Bradyrhizobium sp.]|nr:hypothetical protein CDS [Bradyrhizobium sp.]